MKVVVRILHNFLTHFEVSNLDMKELYYYSICIFSVNNYFKSITPPKFFSKNCKSVYKSPFLERSSVMLPVVSTRNKPVNPTIVKTQEVIYITFLLSLTHEDKINTTDLTHLLSRCLVCLNFGQKKMKTKLESIIEILYI